MHYVFVYGSLKQGEYHHYLLKQNPHFLGKLEGYVLLTSSANYPAITEGNGYVEGEINLVDDDTLRALDHLEGHPTFYIRKKVMVAIETTPHKIESWTYVIVNPNQWVKANQSNWSS